MSHRLVFLPAVLFLSLATLSSCSKKDPYTGMWSWKVTNTPEGNFSGEMALRKSDDGYAGTFMLDGNAAPLEDVKLEDGKLSFAARTVYAYVKVTGDITAESFTGEADAEGYTFPFMADKISDTSPAP